MNYDARLRPYLKERKTVVREENGTTVTQVVEVEEKDDFISRLWDFVDTVGWIVVASVVVISLL